MDMTMILYTEKLQEGSRQRQMGRALLPDAQ